MPQTICDIGVHHGHDSAFYLAKGFRVVGVEANPQLCEQLRRTFAEQISRGTYALVECAISDQPNDVEFFINLDKDDLSSTNEMYGARAGTRHQRVRVPAITIDSLVLKHAPRICRQVRHRRRRY
jgi:FkbM family methyltransferase